VTAATETETTEPTATTPAPDTVALLSGELLRELGSCDSYVRQVDRLYPSADYPDGGPVTGDVCAANANSFDWSWAVEIMLTPEARRAYNDRAGYDAPERRALQQRLSQLETAYHARRRWLQDREQQFRDRGVDTSDRTYPLTWDDSDVANSPAVPLRVDPTVDTETSTEAPFAGVATTRRAANDAIETWYRDALKPVDVAYNELGARVFGELFEDPVNRSDKFGAARRAARRRIRQRALDQVTQLEQNVKYTRDEAARLTGTLPGLERRLEEARRVAAPHLRAQAADDAAEAAERLDRHRAAAEAEERRLAEAADAAAAELARVEEELRAASGDAEPAASAPTGD
jgi:hypothetical protein